MSKIFTLVQYIEFKTAATVAREMAISEASVYQWKYFKAAPRPHHAAKLISMTNGLLTWESIYQPFVNANIEEQLSFEGM